MREERDLKGHLSSPDLGGKQQAPETRDLLPFIFMESTPLPLPSPPFLILPSLVTRTASSDFMPLSVTHICYM